MRCYYDVLGVSKNVELSDLKRAYYKLSLQWHPDKNTDAEDTTQVFQQIQEAYRVLSDPHERAWYDTHRTQILQSGQRKEHGAASTVYSNESIDVFLYFTRSCFQGFDDGEKGFYTVYRKVFEAIAGEEACAISEIHSDSEELSPLGNSRSYPSFGFVNSGYSTIVAPFYQFWEAFRTRKSYSWLDKYDTRFANSRLERRAMEAENCRLRNAARRKRNEEVRELVAYVKKRDTRVALEKKRMLLASQEAQSRIQNASKEAKQRNTERLIEAWEEEVNFGGLGAQWSKDLEDELLRLDAELDGMSEQPKREISNEQSAEEDELLSDSDELYCVACDKLFSSLKAKINHESSKKHKKQAELLRLVLLAEDGGDATHPVETSDKQLDNTPPDGLSSHSLGEVKLTKRAKKAHRRRLHEAERQITESTVQYTEVEPILQEHMIPIVSDPTPKSSSSKPQKDTVDTALSCTTCGSHFPSRNRLFAHLNESGHAVAKVLTKKSKRKR